MFKPLILWFLRWTTNLIDPYAPAKGAPPQTLIAFVRWCLAGAWPVIIVAALISAFAGFFETGAAYILGLITDRAIASGPEAFFTTANIGLFALGLGFFLVLRPLAFAASNASTSLAIAPSVAPMIMARLHRWMLDQSVDFFDNDFAGRLAQKQAQTSNALTDLTIESINVVAFAIASLVGTLAIITAIDLRLSVLFAAWLVLYGALIRYFLPRVRLRAKARAGARAVVTGQVVDTISNMRTVKLFAGDGFEDRAALDAVDRYRAKMIGFGALSAGFRLSLMAVAGLLPVLLTGGAMLAWAHGSASTGDIVAAGVVGVRVAQMTGWVSFSLMGMYRSIGEVEDGMRTLTPDLRLRDSDDAQPLHITKGGVHFDKVSFAYGKRSGGVSGVELQLRPGEKLGLVGASGAGKSTLVSLLMRLYDPESGRILIDDQDIAQVTQISLRSQIGMVTQDTAMFNRSARDNILYGRPEADEAALMKAAQNARALEFIEGLEDQEGRRGFDAHLGERGVKLSGGQRQRIAIARAMLKNAPILVLDEATSALDSHVEADIQDTLYELMEGKTVIAIAHRLSTIAHMDRIIVLADGKIAESGTHADLVASQGLYAGLWARQSGGFLGEN
ncbi:MAG: ABC transporter ATP-binding protein [Maritimibacter sp.]